MDSISNCAGLKIVEPIVGGWKDRLGEYRQRPTELVCGLARGWGVDECRHKCVDESQPPPTRVGGGLEEVCLMGEVIVAVISRSIAPPLTRVSGGRSLRDFFGCCGGLATLSWPVVAPPTRVGGSCTGSVEAKQGRWKLPPFVSMYCSCNFCSTFSLVLQIVGQRFGQNYPGKSPRACYMLGCRGT